MILAIIKTTTATATTTAFSLHLVNLY